jgi:saccharopine dehydrogenase-like NADP-dependent oxidoreductase
MVARVLIIGAYGHFGGYIARSLAGDAEIRLLVGGRSIAKAQAFIASIRAHPSRRSPCDRHQRRLA